MRNPFSLCVILISLILVPVFGHADADTPQAAAPLVQLPNARRPAPHLLTGGQPTLANLEQAAADGYALVVNLRTPDEMSWDEASAAHKLAMDYLNIPVGGPADINRANAQALDAALRAAGDRPVILHCASGNRAGALLALRAGLLDGASTDDALKLGKAAGLTGLEGRVKEVLTQAKEAN